MAKQLEQEIRASWNRWTQLRFVVVPGGYLGETTREGWVPSKFLFTF